MQPGININATHCRVIGSMLSQGVPYDEIAETVVDATMLLAEKNGLASWMRDAELNDRRAVARQRQECYRIG